MAAQINAIRINYVKVSSEETQQNGRCKWCGDRDECRKLAQREYNTRHNWVGKVIYSEFCKRSKFYHVNKWYMHCPESVLENEKHRILWDFDKQTN